MAAIDCPTRPEPTDEELIYRFRTTHDAAAFESLVHRYERALFGYLRRYLHSAEMAEDAFQATFLRVHLNRDRFEEGRKFRPWLYSIATHQAIDAQRRNRRHRMATLDRCHAAGTDGSSLSTTVASRDGTADERAEEAENREWIRSAVGSLSEAQRLVLQLVYHKGMKYREVAESLGLPVGTVKSRVSAALLKLGDLWRQAEWGHGRVVPAVCRGHVRDMPVCRSHR
jgi:RNA polymerase sigma-70 factor (ECF subfamily)